MLLTIDVGNSNIVFGVFDGNDIVFQDRFETYYTESQGDLWWENLKVQLTFPIKNAILSSVVPERTSEVLQRTTHYFGINPALVNASMYEALPITIFNKSEIGTDLVANALMAYTISQDYCMAIDFGTALTFTTISDKGEIMGVSIAPGINTAMYSLFQKAAQLPEVPLEVPDSVLGKNTIHALQSGVLLGYVGLVKEMIRRTEKEIGHKCKIIATGGLSFVLKEEIEMFDVVDKTLTLRGLKEIWNCTNAS